MKRWLRRRLYLLASWFKMRFCDHGWQAVDTRREAASDHVRCAFHCAQCNGWVLVHLTEEAWQRGGWAAACRKLWAKGGPWD